MASSRVSSCLCLKRKLVEDCLSKECKSRRVKVGNGLPFDSSAKRCNCYCAQTNLSNDCDNFLNSGVPSCIMHYKQGSWHNFPEQIMKSLIEEFSDKKSSVVIVMDGESILVDFLSMSLVNLKSRKQRSVAWYDETGKCFFPSLFFDQESGMMVKGDAANVEGAEQATASDKVVNSPPEVVKQVVLESDPPVPQKSSTADILHKKITSVKRGSEDFLFVQDLFLSGMGPFATPNNLLHVHRYSPDDISAQCRLEAFERQMRSTKEERGDANVRYGWLGSGKNDIVRILINGLGTTGKSVEKSGLSAGVYLSPENQTFTSVGLCDVDEKNVQYMLLCRVILGNMETIKPGSQGHFPSSEKYDSGVDDCLNPKCYVMWPSRLSTHIRLEYLISFRLDPKFRNYLLGLKGVWFHPSPKDVAVNISTLQPEMCETGEGPITPWISFKVLFGIIQNKISSIAKDLLLHHYQELKESKMTREEMVKKMIIVVGQKILFEAVTELHYCPSLWYRTSARTAAEQLSLDTKGSSCNNGDSHAPNAMAEHSTALSAKGRSSLTVDMFPEGNGCLAPSSVQERPCWTGAICQGPQGMEPEGRDSPIQVTPPENSAPPCARNQDLFVGRRPSILQDGLLRTTSGRSASPGVEICSSQNNVSKGHGSSSPGFTPGSKGCEPTVPSLAPGNSESTDIKWLKPGRNVTLVGCEPTVPSLAPGNSESTGIKRLKPGQSVTLIGCESTLPSLSLGNSESTGMIRPKPAPRVTPEGQEFLSLSLPSQNPVIHLVKGPDGSTSVAIPPPAVALGREDSPSLRTQGCDSLALSITPKSHDPPASSQGLKRKRHEDAATKAHISAPTPITGETKDLAAALGRLCDKLPGPVIDASSCVVRAADTLLALSTQREKGGH